MEVAVGVRVLGEVEEMSLEEVLQSLRSSIDVSSLQDDPARTQAAPRPLAGLPKLTHIPVLDQIVARHFRDTHSAPLSISGRHLPLLYVLISNLLSPPHDYAVLLIDLEQRFDATRLTCPPSALPHLYIQRPARLSPDQLRALVADAETFMLYGTASRPSAAREWWGTVVVGGLGAGDVAAAWKGWLRVERQAVKDFGKGVGVEAALEMRARRQEAVDAAGWLAASPWGGFVFTEEGEVRGEEEGT